MNTDNLKNFFEDNGFDISLDKENGTLCAEIETWTKRGVNMIIYLNPFTIEEFKEYVNNFDVDEEITLHRESDKYRKDFTIRQSLIDFENYHKKLKKLLLKLK